MGAQKKRVVTRSSALLDDAPKPRGGGLLDITGVGGGAAASGGASPVSAVSSAPADGGGAHAPGSADEQEAAIRELNALQESNPEAFAQMMAAALAEQGVGDGQADGVDVEKLWREAVAGKGAEAGPRQGARDGEIELPGGKVLKGDGSTRPAEEDALRVVPSPGFVLKTTAKPAAPEGMAAAGEVKSVKYFINICAHEAVGVPKQVKRLDDQGKEVEGVSVPVSIGPQNPCEDNKKDPCVSTDCVVNPRVLADADEDKTGAQRDFLCQLAMTYVEQKYKLAMDRKYKLPRLKYKGDPEANAQWVRDASKRAGVEEATAGDKWKAARTKATMALGPAPAAQVWYAPTSTAPLAKAPATPEEGPDAWPVVLLPRGPRGGFSKLPHDADRPYAVVARLSLPRSPGSADPFLNAKVAVSAFGVKCALPGREPLKLGLPFCVDAATATATRAKPTKSSWVLDVECLVDAAPFGDGPDPGSKPWLVARAIRGAAPAKKADDADAAAPAEPAAPADRYRLRKPAPAPAASAPGSALEKPPPGASAHELAYAAAHAADVAARAADNSGEGEGGAFAEDKFHKADILSQHYINQRESTVKEKKENAEKERKENAKDPNIEYLDMDDFRPGGKFAPSDGKPAPLPPKKPAEPEKPPPPPVTAAPLVDRPADTGVALESSLWAELL